jgi:thioesterase domain-containing protein/SAM-dependent methyltransferase/acyl carrier protein
MVPSFFVRLESFPLNNSGKTDRQALPKPDLEAHYRSDQYVEPKTELQCRLAEIWSKYLSIDRIGLHDSFIKLGGNSLLAIQLCSRIRKEFSVSLSPYLLLSNLQTICCLDQALTALMEKGENMSHITPIQVIENAPNLFFVHAAMGNALIYKGLENKVPEFSIYGIENPRFSSEKSFSSIEEMASAYVAKLIEEFPDGPYFLAGFSFGGVVAYEMARQLQAVEKKVARVILFDSVLTGLMPAEIIQKEKEMLLARLTGLAPKLMEELGREIERNMALLSHYQAGPYEGKVTLVKAVKPTFSDPNIDISIKGVFNGWWAWVDLDVYTIDLSHSELFGPESSDTIASQLKEIFSNQLPHRKVKTLPVGGLPEHRQELVRKEMVYYERTRIDSSTKPAVELIITDIKRRRAITLYENFNEAPQDIFIVKLDDRQYVGRKSLSEAKISGRVNELKDTFINASMLLGVLIDFRVTQEGVVLYYYPVNCSEKLRLYESISQSPTAEISHPFPYLTPDRKEPVCPVEFWDASEEQIKNLDNGEEKIRAYTNGILGKLYPEKENRLGLKVYDPACSTGGFLRSIKESFPEVTTIGQDFNQSMVEEAKKIVDKVFLGDASRLSVEKESVDLIVIRFLNLEVLPVQVANDIFPALANCCKDGGHIIVVGHTPILLNSGLFYSLGLEVKQCSGMTEDGIFQFYLLEKRHPVLQLTHEQLTTGSFGLLGDSAVASLSLSPKQTKPVVTEESKRGGRIRLLEKGYNDPRPDVQSGPAGQLMGGAT